MKTEALFMDQKSPVKKALSKSLFRQSVPEDAWHHAQQHREFKRS